MMNHLNTHLKKKERNASVKPTEKQQKSKVSCTACSKMFTGKSNMQAHYRSKHEGREFACEQCGKKLVSAYARRNHIRAIHEGKISLACKICNKTFSYEQGLAKHIESKSHQKIVAGKKMKK